MSATEHEAVNGAQGALRSLDVAAASEPDVPDFTEDLADEMTSELGATVSVPRLAAHAAPATSTGAAAGERILRDRYRLVAQIGNGGAAIVHRAVDLRRDAGPDGEGRQVAIKLLRPEFRGSAHHVARLQREFRQTQAAAHPNVVRFLDLDREGDAWFIVMELLSGSTLGPILRRSAPAGLPVAEAMRVALAVGDALAHAHARGVVHGDVKPDNVFLTDSGEVRIIDFGVAPDADPAADGGARLEPVPVAATRVYASPQVLARDTPEPRDDVFSFACVVYEMIAGRHPYGRRGVDRAGESAVVPERLASLGPEGASALSAALALSRDGRPPMPELLRALREVDAPIASRAPAGPVAAAPHPAAAWPASPRTSGGPRLTILAGCVAALALVLGVLIGRMAGEEAPMVAPAPPASSVAEKPQPVSMSILPPVQAAALPAATTAPEEPPAEEPVAPQALAGTPGLVFFDAPRMVVSRHSVVAPIPVRHLSRTRRAVSVTWRAIDGSARSGRDYGGPQSGVESFVEGNSFRILYVPLMPNPSSGRDRTFTVELTGASEGIELGPTARVEVTILGDS